METAVHNHSYGSSSLNVKFSYFFYFILAVYTLTIFLLAKVIARSEC